jgi:uncharacterized protein YndB with AHSA1/START domain
MKPDSRFQREGWPAGPPVGTRGPFAACALGGERRRPGRRRGNAIRVGRRFDASPERVFHAFLDPGIAGLWLFATATRPLVRVAIDPRVGGAFCLVERRYDTLVEHRGEYVAIVPHRRVCFTLCADRGRVTRAAVEIAPLRRGCRLTLTHDDVAPGDANYGRARWTGILYGLAATLDALSDPIHSHGRQRCNIC